MKIEIVPESKKQRKRTRTKVILVEWKLSNITWYGNYFTFSKVRESKWVAVPFTPLRKIFFSYEKLFLAPMAMDEKRPLRLRKKAKRWILEKSLTPRRRPLVIFADRAASYQLQAMFKRQPSFQYVVYPLESDSIPDRTYVDLLEEEEDGLKFYLRPFVY